MNYKAIIDTLYHYVWTELNQLDVLLDNAALEEVEKLEAERRAYWNVLAHLDAAAAADRIRSYEERDRIKAGQ